MTEIKFETGLEEYTLKGVREAKVYLNPTDTNFVERLFATFEKLDTQQE